MPNEFKSPKSSIKSNSANNQSGHWSKKETVFVSTWIVGGILLTGCVHDRNKLLSVVAETGDDQAGLRGAFDGPVKGAKIYIDENGTGILDPDAPFFVTDGIATTAGELGIKIIGVADAQGEGSISRDERSDIGQSEESFIYTSNYGEFEIENQNSFASDIL